MYPTAAYAKATNIFLFFLYYCILTTVEETSNGVTSQPAEPEESLHNLGINHLWLKDVSGREQIREDDFFFDGIFYSTSQTSQNFNFSDVYTFFIFEISRSHDQISFHTTLSWCAST